MPHPTSSICGLDPALLTALGDLELVARVTVDGMLSGLHNSPFHGYSAEFSQYRHYRSGDDLKYVDWKLFARTDRLYTKQYRETTNLVAQVMVDASQSMAFRGQTGVTKLDYARMVAAALAYLIAGQGDAVGLAIYDEAVRQYVPSRIGQSHLRAVLTALARMQTSGHDLGRAFAAPRRSICSAAAACSSSSPISMTMRRPSRPSCGAPSAWDTRWRCSMCSRATSWSSRSAQEVELEDLESGRRVLTGSAAAADYRHAFAEFLERWHARCARDRIDYTRIVTDQPLDAALRSYLLRRGGSAAR